MYFAYRNHRYVDCSGLSFRVRLLTYFCLVLSNITAEVRLYVVLVNQQSTRFMKVHQQKSLLLAEMAWRRVKCIFVSSEPLEGVVARHLEVLYAEPVVFKYLTVNLPSCGIRWFSSQGRVEIRRFLHNVIRCSQHEIDTTFVFGSWDHGSVDYYRLSKFILVVEWIEGYQVTSVFETRSYSISVMDFLGMLSLVAEVSGKSAASSLSFDQHMVEISFRQTLARN